MHEKSYGITKFCTAKISVSTTLHLTKQPTTTKTVELTWKNIFFPEIAYIFLNKWVDK